MVAVSSTRLARGGIESFLGKCILRLSSIYGWRIIRGNRQSGKLSCVGFQGWNPPEGHGSLGAAFVAGHDSVNGAAGRGVPGGFAREKVREGNFGCP